MRSLLLAVAATLLLAAPASAAPTWLPPVDLGAETADTSSSGKIALGADGTAVAAWAQFTGSTYVLQVARRKPGEAFGAAITVPGASNASLTVGGVGVDGAGNATIAYQQGGSIIAQPWPAAEGAPGAPQPFETGTSPTIDVGRNGTAVIAWINADNPNAPVVKAAARDGAGGVFGAASTISFLGNGMNSITGLDVAVGDSGNATVVWSRITPIPNTVVEATERAPGGSFPPNGGSISNSVGAVVNINPAVAVDPSGRSTVLWENQNFSRIDYAENVPGQVWSTPQPASLTNPAATPAIGVAPSGAVVGAWQSGGAIETAARPAGGGGFADYRTLTGAAMDASLPIVVVGGNGDALISWSTITLHELYTVRRAANGTFGPIQSAYSNGGRAGENYFNPSLGIDDQGNGVAAWTLTQTRNAVNFYRFQAASFDAAAPALSSSVPPGGTVGAAVGMAAAASDRVSPVSIAWNFGDGSTASGGAVAHAFGTAGAFTVTVTATDAAGNQSSQSHPVLVAAAQAKRITSPVRVAWGVNKKRLYLLRMSATRVPKGAKAELRCARRKSGKKCPLKRKSSKRIRNRSITLFKQVKVSKVAKKKKRTFRAGQRLVLRITAPGYIGKAIRYDLRKSKIPSGKTFCMRVGTSKLRKRC